MRFAGFNFDKISVEKFSEKAENIKANTKMNISKIDRLEGEFLNSKEELIIIKFSYVIDYEPDFAKVDLLGNVIIALEPEIAKKFIKQKGDNQIPEEFRVPIINFILRKLNVRALQLEEELNLPLHLPLASLKEKGKEESEEKK